MDTPATRLGSRPGSSNQLTSRTLVARLDAAAKRLTDLTLSLAGVVLLAPLFVLIGIFIKRSSPGPVFYRGLRTGRFGEVFDILKFRTMYESAESYQGPRVTAADDPRVTPLGRWLRGTKLNELPQLWNVLRGDMSLVGPRPEDPDIAAEWPEDFRQEVLSVRPGISSPASIVYRDEESLLATGNVMDDYLRVVLPSKLRLDQLYVRNRSLLTDLDVIFWTSFILLPRLRRLTVPEHLLYWGPLSLFISRHFVWFLIDLLVSLVAGAAAMVVWPANHPVELQSFQIVTLAIALAAIFGLINSRLGLNRIEWSRARNEDILDLAFSSGLAVLGLLLLTRVNEPLRSLPNGIILIMGMFAMPGFVAVRYRGRILEGLGTRWSRLRGARHALAERVLIIGAGDAGQFGASLLRMGSLAGAFSIVGMVDDDPRKRGLRINGSDVVGGSEDIPQLIAENDIGLVLFAITEISPENREQILSRCRKTAARLLFVADILENLHAQFPYSDSDPGQTKTGGDVAPVMASVAVRGWLDELDQLIQANDWTAIVSRISEMKGQLDRQVETGEESRESGTSA